MAEYALSETAAHDKFTHTGKAVYYKTAFKGDH